jgi:hypothetical protein
MIPIDPERYTPETYRLIQSEPALKSAAEWLQNFAPNPDVDYKWVCEFAKKQWETRLGVYQKLDDKASSIVNWLGGGTGFFAIATTVAVVKGELTALVGTFMLFPIVTALVAVWKALVAREGQDFYAVMDVRLATEWAESFHPHGEAASLAEWHPTLTSLKTVCTERSRRVNDAIWWAFRAVLLLLFPFVVAIIQRVSAENQHSSTPATVNTANK